jgi:hypothetical protein
MRKWILAFVAVLAVAFAPALAAAEQEFVGVQYSWAGPAGLVTIQNAAGQPFSITNSSGFVVAQGTVPSQWFSIPAINSGPDASGVLLTVRVGHETAFIAGEWWTWM